MPTTDDSVLDQQPVAIAEAVKALALSILSTLVLFGLKLSADQVAGIVLVLGNGMALATIILVPRRVSTKATVQHATDAAFVAGVAEGKDQS